MGRRALPCEEWEMNELRRAKNRFNWNVGEMTR